MGNLQQQKPVLCDNKKVYKVFFYLFHIITLYERFEVERGCTIMSFFRFVKDTRTLPTIFTLKCRHHCMSCA